MNQCQAFTDGGRGRRCFRKAVAGQQFCGVHQRIVGKLPGQQAALTPDVQGRNIFSRNLQQPAALNLGVTSSGTFGTTSFVSSQHQQQQTTTSNSSLTSFSFGNPQPTSIFGNASTGFFCSGRTASTQPTSMSIDVDAFPAAGSIFGTTNSAGNARLSEPDRPAFGMSSMNPFGRSQMTTTTNGFGQPTVSAFGASSSSNLGVPIFGPSQQQTVPTLNSSSTPFSFGSQQPVRLRRAGTSLGSAGSGLISTTTPRLFGDSTGQPQPAMMFSSPFSFGQPQPQSSISNSRTDLFGFGASQPASVFGNSSTTSTSMLSFGRTAVDSFGRQTQTSSLSGNSSGEPFGQQPPTSQQFSLGKSDERKPDYISLMLPD